MSVENPSNRVRRKQGKAMPKLAGPGQLPGYSGTNPGDTERNKLHGFAEIEGEIDYLKRLSLRSSLAGSTYSDFVPDLSEREIMVGDYLKKLNEINRDPAQRMVMENLFHRFNSRNVYNICQELSDLKLARQSVQELEALIDGGVAAFTQKATGLKSESAKRAQMRKTFSEANARVDFMDTNAGEYEEF